MRIVPGMKTRTRALALDIDSTEADRFSARKDRSRLRYERRMADKRRAGYR